MIFPLLKWWLKGLIYSVLPLHDCFRFCCTIVSDFFIVWLFPFLLQPDFRFCCIGHFRLQTFIGQLFPECPYRLFIGYFVATFKPKKLLKTQPVYNLVFKLCVAQSIIPLKYQYLEHHYYIIWLCSRRALLSLVKTPSSNVSLNISKSMTSWIISKGLPIDVSFLWFSCSSNNPLFSCWFIYLRKTLYFMH